MVGVDGLFCHKVTAMVQNRIESMRIFDMQYGVVVKKPDWQCVHLGSILRASIGHTSQAVRPSVVNNLQFKLHLHYIDCHCLHSNDNQNVTYLNGK